MRSIKRLLAVLLASLLALSCVEGAARVLSQVRGGSLSTSHLRERVEELRRSALQDFESPGSADDEEEQATTARAAPSGVSEFRLHPYTGYARAAFDENLKRAMERNDPGHLVMIIGGSVAAGFANQATEYLRSRPPFSTHNLVPYQAAVAGYKQPQQLHLVAHLLSLGLRPAMIVNIDGFNEVALGSANVVGGLDPSQPSKSHWLGLARGAEGAALKVELAAQVFNLRSRFKDHLERAQRFGLLRSAVTGQVVLRDLRDIERELRELRSKYVEISSAGDLPPHLVGPLRRGMDVEWQSTRIWVNSSAAIRAMCESWGIDYIHVLQPTLHDPGSKQLTDEEVTGGRMPPAWVEGAERGYPMLRIAGAKLAADGELFLDASMVFADVAERLYYDGCHFDREGNRLLAEALCEFVDQADRDGRLTLDD